jgi:MFS family permease
VPIASNIVSDLNNGNGDKSASVLLVTIWELGEAIGPFLLAPISEIIGRYPVYNFANMLFISAVLLANFSQTVPLFIAARILNGMATAANVLNPAVIADIFPSEQRGGAMSFIMMAPLIGGAVGPVISGAIVQTSGWHNVLWMSVALAGACELVFLICFRETYKVTILRSKAARLRRETGNQQLRTAYDAQGDEKKAKKLWDSIMRPTITFFSSGVLQALSLFGSVVFSFFYIMSTTLPDILQDRYHLEPAQMGSAFLGFSVYLLPAPVLC